MNRAFTNTTAAVIVLILAFGTKTWAQNAAAPAKASAGDSAKTAEQVFKNIQALKGAPADQLQPAMQFISSSLGVECGVCHVQGAFEKDDKEAKQTARKMIQMQMAINRDNFKGEREVTCFTCHQGSPHPVAIPIIADTEAKRFEMPMEDPSLPSADQIFAKYVQAVGGADAIQKNTSRVEKGIIDFSGRQFPVEIAAKAPNKRISTMHLDNGDNITAYDGHAGWLGSPEGLRDLTPQEVDVISFDATFYFPTEIKKMFAQFRVRPSDKIGGHDVIQVIGTNPGKPPSRLFFDKESGLLLRTIRYIDTPLGRNPTQVDYTDYRADGGVKIPYQWTVARPLLRFTIKVSDVQQNVPVDDKKFEKPAAVPKTEQKGPAK